MPLFGESERVLPQSGHSTNATPLSANRLRSMETSPKNVHLDDVLVCACSFNVSPVFIVFCCSFPLAALSHLHVLVLLRLVEGREPLARLHQ